MADSAVPNPLISMLFFFIITTIYCIIKFFISKTSSTSPSTANNMSTVTICNVIYLLIIIIGEYFINVNLTDMLCGDKQYSLALLVTLLPWIVIFGSLFAMIKAFPSLLSPFSNTIGYLAIKLSGYSDYLEKVTTDNNIKAYDANILSTFNPALINNIKSDDTRADVSLKNFILYKNIVAEWIWYMLTGGLVTSVSYNFIVNYGCNTSAKDMKKKRLAYEQRLKTQQEAKDVPKQVFSTTE